ncbi:MAG: hypothetical protein HRF40_12465 [Nitrososphaera sp.]
MLENHYPNWVFLQTIYREIEQYRPLTDYEKQPWKEGKSQLRYENKIRTVLSDMAEEGGAQNPRIFQNISKQVSEPRSGTG